MGGWRENLGIQVWDAGDGFRGGKKIYVRISEIHTFLFYFMGI